MTPLKTLVIAAVVACTGAGAAFAQPGFCPPGQAKKGNCGGYYDDKYWRDYRAEDRAYDQGYREGRRDAQWEIGRPLPRDMRYVVIRDYDRYHLRAPPRGYYYADVDGRILLIAAATSIIVDALTRN
jgi:Ni/Co efflux regulator RcnB